MYVILTILAKGTPVDFSIDSDAKLESTLVEAETSMSTTKWIESSHLDSIAKSSTAQLPVEDQGLDIALVAGVNELFDRNMFEPFVCAGMLSSTGRCHTFDASADGYV